MLARKPELPDALGKKVNDKIVESFIAFTKACLKSIREVDVLGRLGGDEFAIILSDTNSKEAYVAAQRIYLAINSCRFLSDEGEALSMTASIGMTIVDFWNPDFSPG